MNVSIIGTAGVPSKYGGFETLAENLAKFQSSSNKYTIFCSSKIYTIKKEEYLNAKLKYINLKPNGISSIIYDIIAMLQSLNTNIMLVLGISGAIFFPIIKLLYHGIIITNIDGIEWKRSKWNVLVQFYLHLSEEMAIKYSDIIIGDNKGIIDYVKETYNKVAILIEYGADHIQKIGCDNELFNKKYPFNKKKYAIGIYRIEPENNIHLILEAFARQKSIELVIVGNWKNSKYGLSLIERYSKFSHIYLLDQIYDYKDIGFLRTRAFLNVHGHSRGGTNPSLVEAMYFGLPILAFDCIYNRYTTENQCIYWSSAEELYNYLLQLNEKKLNDIGEKMELIADNRYRWSIIASKYEELYQTYDNH
ncbi:DUF1972 domain-containing protein [Treponema primitia]|uniref:DUF1972 domain-containing protein n=1 Tax=Treponema primitia TaxID=88058 RepID=UPI003980CDE6